MGETIDKQAGLLQKAIDSSEWYCDALHELLLFCREAERVGCSLLSLLVMEDGYLKALGHKPETDGNIEKQRECKEKTSQVIGELNAVKTKIQSRLGVLIMQDCASALIAYHSEAHKLYSC